MSEAKELDEILTGEQPEVVDEPTGEVTEPAAPEPKEAAPPVAEKDDKPPPGFVPHQALAEERRKRQEYERELATYRQKLEALEKPPAAKPNLFEDPDNWEKVLDERLESKIQLVRQESEQKFLQLCEQRALERYTDFEDVAKVFAETAQTTPGLIDEARRAADPAEFIYRSGLNLKRFKEAGSIDALIAQAEARGEERARQSTKPVPEIPESLTDIAGGKGESRESWSGPKPLTQLLPSI